MDEGLAEYALAREVSRLEREQAKLDVREDYHEAGYFTVRPTCPPSAGFYVQGGRIAMVPSWDGVTYYLRGGLVDLETHQETYWDHVFTNAGWYLPLYVTVNWLYTAWDSGYVDVTDAVRFHGAEPGPGFGYSGGGFVEFETAAEAEDAIDAKDPRYLIQDHIVEEGIPIARIVLRNNGDTARPNQFLPVEMANRGQSYLWGKFYDGRMKL